MRKEIPEIWGVIKGGEIKPESVGMGRNFTAKRYLGDKHSRNAWKTEYNRGARLVRLYVKPWIEPDV